MQHPIKPRHCDLYTNKPKEKSQVLRKPDATISAEDQRCCPSVCQWSALHLALHISPFMVYAI